MEDNEKLPAIPTMTKKTWDQIREQVHLSNKKRFEEYCRQNKRDALFQLVIILLIFAMYIFGLMNGVDVLDWFWGIH